MRNLAKYAAHICGIYAAYAAYEHYLCFYFKRNVMQHNAQL